MLGDINQVNPWLNQSLKVSYHKALETVKVRNLSTILTVTLMLYSSLTSAATDGGLGLSSNGTSDITITKGNRAQITDMDDFVFASINTAVTGTDTICVYNTTATYLVAADSANGAGVFRVADGINSIVYTAEWDDGSGFSALGEGVGLNLTGQIGSAVTGCGGINNAALRVSISAANMTAAPSGIYTDTLSITVAPE
ncbi:MAG: hypothetical protein AAF512_14545 [Pseudomonadota bacterium]